MLEYRGFEGSEVSDNDDENYDASHHDDKIFGFCFGPSVTKTFVNTKDLCSWDPAGDFLSDSENHGFRKLV